ncbi:hypothetical protein GPECTOR_3g17 [Gonium pectorale]|uniref:DNA-directed RNA polymerase I subunit rpa49 n=1 Tax=Gonium pectorale TaxID=33097 RepID=A0A150GYM7_GONPE|nr:hypothetical protein GPECTOR_3g17 [Gonium pectorale]|eukprot:KXZ55006.1 hypothetical protein GPECTOR_3g17 [Gonium pectorale]
MSAKRPRVAVEAPEPGQAALPAVCYLPSMLADNPREVSTSTGAAAGTAAKRLKYSLHARTRDAGHPTQLVHASTGEIDYVGRSDGDENAGVQPCVYALAVYTPASPSQPGAAGKLRLVSVAGQRPFRLDTRLPGLVYAPTGAGAEEDVAAREAKRLAAKRLVDEFGSTRRRRQLTAREAGQVAPDKISGGGAVQEMLGGVAARGQGEGLTREEMERRAFSTRTVPPHDPSATTAAAAYPLSLLLGAGAGGAGGGDHVGDLGAHTGQLYRLLESEEEMATAREKELLAPYVLDRLSALRALKSSTDPAAASRAKQRTRYLALLGLLLRVQSKPKLRSADGDALSKDLRCRQEGLRGLLLDRFYTHISDPLLGERYERTDAQKALLLSYILAVAVVAEEGYLSPEEFNSLRTALKMDAAKLCLALQQIGCTTKAVKLKVPDANDVVTEVPSFSASLLRPDPKGTRMLAECFPAIKLARGKGKGR